MTIRFSAEMKIESKNYNIPTFIYSKIEKTKFNTNMLVFILLIQITRIQKVKFLFDQVYSNTQVPAKVSKSQPEALRIYTNPHEST